MDHQVINFRYKFYELVMGIKSIIKFYLLILHRHMSKVSGMSVGTYLILILLIRLVGLLLSAGIVLYISTKVKSYSMTLLVSTGILLIPLVLYYLKLDWMKKVLMNFFFLMNIT